MLPAIPGQWPHQRIEQHQHRLGLGPVILRERRPHRHGRFDADRILGRVNRGVRVPFEVTFPRSPRSW